VHVFATLCMLARPAAPACRLTSNATCCLFRNGYGVDPPGQANLAIASSAVGQRYKCLAFTLEMPFKDTEYSQEPVRGVFQGFLGDFRPHSSSPLLHTGACMHAEVISSKERCRSPLMPRCSSSSVHVHQCGSRWVLCDDTLVHAQVQGWSPERSVRFGAAMLNAILAVLPDLR
jgi:hypothetical protein